jgi:hypothetical protein
LHFRTFNNYWKEAHEKLEEQLAYENVKEEVTSSKARDNVYSHAMLMYVRYVQIFRKLEVQSTDSLRCSLLMTKWYIHKREEY